MQDTLNAPEETRTRENANKEVRDNKVSREGDHASDSARAPVTGDNPAPLSDALNIPTLMGESSRTDESRASVSNTQDEPRSAGASWLKIPASLLKDRSPKRDQGENNEQGAKDDKGQNGQFDQFGRNRTPGETPQNTNRATTPADPPHKDAGTLIGVPSNHQQTEISARLAKLDKVALALGATMTIGPLFAAMVARSMS